MIKRTPLPNSIVLFVIFLFPFYLSAQNLSVAGNAGIGTNNPTPQFGNNRVLEIEGNLPQILFDDTDGNAQNDFRIANEGSLVDFFNVTAGQNIMSLSLINNNVGLGLGANIPNQRLTINGNIGFSPEGNRSIVVEEEPDNTTNGKDLIIRAGNASSSGQPFLAKRGGNLILQAGFGYNVSVNGADGGDVIIRSGANHRSSVDDGGDIIFETGGAIRNFTERARMLEGGALGIGTSSPADLLEVQGADETTRIRVSTTTGNNAAFRATTPNADFQWYALGGGSAFRLFDFNAGADRILVGANGNVSVENALTVDDRLAVGRNLVPNYRAIMEAGTFTNGLFLEGSNATLFLSGDGFAAKPGGGDWAATSDRRLKKDIKDYSDGLEILRKVNTVRFHYNGKDRLPTAPEYIGVIAQELEELAPYMVSERDGVEDPAEKYLMVDPTAFTYMLINSVQDLDEDNRAKDRRIEDLEAKNEALESRLDQLEALYRQLAAANDGESTGSNYGMPLEQEPTLAQNHPNPFSENTRIEYFVPEYVKDARIQVTSPNGKVLGRIDILEKGQGTLTIKANSYPAGTYYYSLVLDGKVLATKPMVLTK